MTTIYRSGAINTTAPGLWWTPNEDYARFYGERDGTELHEDYLCGRTLDLTRFGVELTAETAEELEALLDDLGIPYILDASDWEGMEVHHLLDDTDFARAAFQFGYCAITCLQRHHEFDSESEQTAILVRQ